MCRKHDSLRKRKDNLQLAFDSASKKDMQLQESLKMHSNSKKKTKQLLEEQKKMVEQYESVPDKNSAVKNVFCGPYEFIDCFFLYSGD